MDCPICNRQLNTPESSIGAQYEIQCSKCENTCIADCDSETQEWYIVEDTVEKNPPLNE